MEVHVTERSTFKFCRRQWRYAYRDNLTSRNSPHHALWIGQGVHIALAAYYRGDDPMQSLDQWFWSELGPDQSPEEQREAEETKLLMTTMIVGYLEFAKTTDDFEVIAVETPLSARIRGTHATLVGTLDLLVRRRGRLWVVDHKTCASFADPLALELDDQMTAYLWLVAQIYGEVPAGAVYNQLRKKIPAEPMLLQSGMRLSKDKSVDTTPEKYLAAIRQYGFNEVDYEDILASLKQNEFFKRELIARNSRELESFGKFLVDECREMLSVRTSLYPNPTRDCSWGCSYRVLCKSDSEGGDTDALKSTLYEVQTAGR